MIVGVDYASVDGNRPPRWDDLKASCIAAGSRLGFAIIRAAYGATTDATLARDWAGAKSAGLTCGAYLFLTSTAPPESQIAAAKSVLQLERGVDFPLTIDVEAKFSSAKVELEWVRRAWDAARVMFGATPMLYTSARVWHEDLKDAPAGDMTASPLWLAKPWPWATRTPARLGPEPFANGELNPSVPTPWAALGQDNWWIHQYQGDALPVPGFSSTVDLSRFNVAMQGAMFGRVSWLQRKLGVAQSGLFGDSTRLAVQAFQSVYGLVADGIVGPKTFAALAWM